MEGQIETCLGIASGHRTTSITQKDMKKARARAWTGASITETTTRTISWLSGLWRRSVLVLQMIFMRQPTHPPCRQESCHVWEYVCMYVRMYVCMCIYICVCRDRTWGQKIALQDGILSRVCVLILSCSASTYFSSGFKHIKKAQKWPSALCGSRFLLVKGLSHSNPDFYHFHLFGPSL